MAIDKNIFINDYKNNTLKILAIKYNVSKMTIWRWAKLLGLNGRKKGSGRKKENPFI